MQRFGIDVARDGWRSFTVRGPATRVRARWRSKATRRARRTSSRPARSAAGRCASPAWGATRSRATSRSRTSSPSRRRRALRQRLDRGSRRRALRGGTIDCIAIPDAAMTLAIVALFADGPTTLDRHRLLAREGDRSPRGDGDRAAQARRDGGGGAGLAAVTPSGQVRAGHASRPTTTTAWRCASRSRRSAGVPVTIEDPGCVRKTFPDYFASPCERVLS